MPEVIHKPPVAHAERPSRERRRADLIKTDRPAYLKVWSPVGGAEMPLVACVIRDASTTGAML